MNPYDSSTMPSQSLINVEDITHEVEDITQEVEDITQEVLSELVGPACEGDQTDMKLEMAEVASDQKQASVPTTLNNVPRETRIRLRWDDRVAQLKEFKAKYGHVDVPRTYVHAGDPSLATFVCNQRQAYKRMSQGKGPGMDERRVKQLEEMGFKWVVRQKDKQEVVEDGVLANIADGANSNEDGLKSEYSSIPNAEENEIYKVARRNRTLDWEEGIEKLKEFKAQNGHMNVAHVHATHQSLGNFVKCIRFHYKRLLKGKSSTLLRPQRINELEDMGFKLVVRQREPWSARFEELKAYVKKNGNCNVPKNTPLGIWVLNQRNQCKLMMINKPSYMTKERIKSLNSVGFDWRIPLRMMQVPNKRDLLPRSESGEGGKVAAPSEISYSNVAIPSLGDYTSADAPMPSIGDIVVPNGSTNVDSLMAGPGDIAVTSEKPSAATSIRENSLRPEKVNDDEVKLILKSEHCPIPETPQRDELELPHLISDFCSYDDSEEKEILSNASYASFNKEEDQYFGSFVASVLHGTLDDADDMARKSTVFKI